MPNKDVYLLPPQSLIFNKHGGPETVNVAFIEDRFGNNVLIPYSHFSKSKEDNAISLNGGKVIRTFTSALGETQDSTVQLWTEEHEKIIRFMTGAHGLSP